MTTPAVVGTCDPMFAEVGAVFQRSFEPDTADPEREWGAALCIIWNGRTVVDLAGGWSDRAGIRPFTQTTLAPVMSATKAWTALVIHGVIEDGRLSLNTPIADVWPEFGFAGKEAITVGEVLDHTAGVPILGGGIRNLGFEPATWERALEQASPIAAPIQRRVYHALTQGYILNAVVRRLTGQGVSKQFEDRFTNPLQLDMAIGLPRAWDDRFTEPAPNPIAPASEPHPLAIEALLEAVDPPRLDSQEFLRGVVPAANGVASARALAGLYAALLDQARSPLSPPTLQAAIAPRWNGIEEIGGMFWRMAAGFMLSGPFTGYGPGTRAFGHPGRGGATAFADPDLKLAVAYIPNRSSGLTYPGPRFLALISALTHCLPEARSAI